MFPTPLLRFAIVSSLLALALLAGIVHGSQPPAPDLGDPPGEDELAADYDRYVGERAVVEGAVVETDPLTVRAVSRSGEPVELRLRGADADAAEGDHLSVHGVVRPGGELNVLGTVRKPAAAYWRTRVLSALAGLWVLGRGLRYWRPDPAALAVCRRRTPWTGPLRSRKEDRTDA